MSLEVKGKRLKNGQFLVEIGPAIFQMPEAVVTGLAQALKDRQISSQDADKQRAQKRLDGYRALATKISEMEDAVIQNVLSQITPAQIISLARISQSKAVYNKIVNNLSRQNSRQFEEDYRENKPISVHQASMHMEVMLPIIRRAVRLRKEQMEN